ncbi:MAG TPA: glycosyltransferase [Thermoanaerobaculia bacterium]|nr:glycosyltransferase [Thermoanaerobaculia bacterium]
MTVVNATGAGPAEAAHPRVAPRVRSAIAVLVTRFPRIDETFIFREINELERAGQPVILVPLFREHAGVVHEEAKPWVGRALYIPLVSGVILRANGSRLFREPRKYLGLLAQLIAKTLPRPSVLIRTLALFPKAVYLAQILPRLGIRHLHAHLASQPATMAYIVHSFSEATYSFTVHGPDVFVHRRLLRQKIAQAKFVRAVSTFTKAFLSGLFPIATKGRIAVVHTGVNPDVYEQAAAEPNIGRTRPRILSVAALTGAKGFTFLIEACARLVEQGIDLECTIVGEGPMRDEIRACVDQHGLAERVRLTGALPQHEVARLLAECDIFVLPSVIAYNGQMDGIPISLMEAMAAGKPVVASAISGIPELVVHEDSGLLVDSTHPERIASSIRRLIEDPALREAMGRAGQKRVRERFDVRHSAARMIELFERHDRVRTTAARSVASLNWEKLGACALGIQRVRERPDSFIAELTITDGISKRDVIVKQHRSAGGKARSEFDVFTRLRASMDVPAAAGGEIVYSVPRVLMFDPDHEAIVMERAGGKPLDALLRDVRGGGIPGGLVIPLRRAGTWLRKMQTVSVSDEDGRHLLTALTVLAFQDLDLAAAADRTLRIHRERIEAALLLLERAVAQRPVPVVGHHGEYSPANVFVGQRRVDVIDLDRWREGLPLEDVAAFLVHVTVQFALPFYTRSTARIQQSFLDGYFESDGPGDDSLRFFKMIKALQLLARGQDDGNDMWAWVRRRALRDIVLSSATMLQTGHP